ncbi:hypothetical protein TL16_g08051 [Triparma laevis f. inornata]|uniref:WD repeat-containing protein on Y chromosome n=1 Tax=Triparma laevis f. inornata TaxID=1714386 RepID=A0A9W7B3B3_9STRA|nr:hypothetical protein TL16_g08051 [Triparma laevis f. inornata]
MEKHLPQQCNLRTFVTTVKKLSEGPLNKEDLEIVIDVFKQIDSRATGSIKWNDVRNYVMASEVIGEAEGGGGRERKWHADANVKDDNTYVTGLRSLTYFPKPIAKLALILNNDEGLQLLVPPEYQSEMPRLSISLRHHTAFKQHKLIECLSIDGIDGIVTSSVMEGRGIGGFVTVWDVPTAREREKGEQFLPVMVERLETEFPQDFLCYSVREEVLFSASKASGMLICSRIRVGRDNIGDEEGKYEERDITKIVTTKPPVFEEEGGGGGEQLPEAPLRSDPKILKDLLNLNIKVKKKELEMAESDARRKEDKDKLSLEMHVKSEQEMILEAEARKAKAKNAMQKETTRQKIPVHMSAISGLLEVRSTDGSNFLLVGSSDGTIASIDLAKPYMESKDPLKHIVRRVAAHEEGVAIMKFSSTSDIILTAGNHCNESLPDIFVWDTHPTTGIALESRTRLPSNGCQIKAIEIIDEENSAIAVGVDGTVLIYKLDDQFELLQKLSPHPNLRGKEVTTVATTPPTSNMPRTLFVCSDRMHIYHCKVLPIHDPILTSFYNPFFSNFVTVTSNRILIWDGSKGDLLRVFKSDQIFGISSFSSVTKEITSCCLDSTGRRLIVGDETGCIKVINFMNGSVRKEFDPHRAAVAFVDYSVTDKCAITAGMDGRLHMVDDGQTEGYKRADTKKGFNEHTIVQRSIEINGNAETFGGKHHNNTHAPSPGHEEDNNHRRSSSFLNALHQAQASGAGSRRGSNLSTMAMKEMVRRASVQSSQGLNLSPPKSHGAGSGVLSMAQIVGVNQQVHNAKMMLAGSRKQSKAHAHGLAHGHPAGAPANFQSHRRSSLSQHPAPGRRMSFLGGLRQNSSSTHDHTELNQVAFSSYLNIIATATTTGTAEYHLHLWDYENCTLIGTCVHPQARSGESYEVSALGLLQPKPFLLGGLSAGIIPIWSILDCSCKLVLVPTTDRKNEWLEAGAKGNSATITSICVINLEDPFKGEVEEEEEEDFTTQLVFASDDKGLIFCWTLSEDVFCEKKVECRRRANFNPHKFVHTLLGGDEMTHYRRQARRAQSRGGIRSRAPSMFWKAHDDTISKISAVEHPPSIISCSHDCLTKVWSIEGILLGVIDNNNPKPSLGLKGGWGFVPSADKGQKSHRHRKEENFAELVDAVHVDDKGIAEAHAMQHNGKVLRRHPSQENFLNKQLHKGQRPTTNGAFLEDAFKSSKLKFSGKYNRRTSWNPMDAKMQIEAERERGEIEELYRGAESKQWDGMMDSLHIFESALGEHTKNRRGNDLGKQSKNYKKRQEVKPWPEFPFKRWGVREDLRELESTKTVRRDVNREVPVIGRPGTSPSKGGRGGGGVGVVVVGGGEVDRGRHRLVENRLLVSA